MLSYGNLDIFTNFFFFKLMFIYFWERKRQAKSMSGGGAQREGDTHRIRSRLQVPSCQHRARSKAQTHEPWDHDLSWSRMLKWLSHQEPSFSLFFLNGHKILFCRVPYPPKKYKSQSFLLNLYVMNDESCWVSMCLLSSEYYLWWSVYSKPFLIF